MEISKIDAGIAVQMENLRAGGLSADDKQLLWDDIHSLQGKKKTIKSRIEQLTKQIDSETFSLEEIERVKSKIASFPRLIQIATYEQKLELLKKIVHHIVVIPNNITGDDEVHIVLCGAEDTVNFNLAHERSVMCHSGIDSIFYASGCVGCQSCSFGRIKAFYAFN